jgi:hypothetical protein
MIARAVTDHRRHRSSSPIAVTDHHHRSPSSIIAIDHHHRE